MSNPWFRMYSEAVDDEKLRLLAFEDRWHFVALLCLKCQGVLDAGDDEKMLQRKVAVKLGLQLRELEAVQLRLQEVGLIGEGFQPIAWNERQYKSDTSAERTRAYRERMKRHGDVTVTAQETDTDSDSDLKPSSSSVTVIPKAEADFADFWEMYPNKVGKLEAMKAWKKAKPNLNEVLRALSWQKKTDKWLKNGGQFVPNPSTYINQGRWLDQPAIEEVF